MQAVVPAAGRGTRLRPLTDSRPKALVDVAGRPLLSYVLDRLVEVAVERIVVVVGYRGGQIVDRYGDSYHETPVRYVEQSEPRGLADAVATAEPHVDDAFVVCNGDNVVRGSIERVVETQRRPSVDATLLVEDATPDIARGTGSVVTDGSGAVTDVVEKAADPPSTTITTGIYAFSPSIFGVCSAVEPSARGEYELADAIRRYRERGAHVRAVAFDGRRVNVNTPDDVRRAEHLFDE